MGKGAKLLLFKKICMPFWYFQKFIGELMESYCQRTLIIWPTFNFCKATNVDWCGQLNKI